MVDIPGSPKTLNSLPEPDCVQPGLDQEKRAADLHRFFNGETSRIGDRDFVLELIALFQHQKQPDFAPLNTLLDAIPAVIYKEGPQLRENAVFLLFHACLSVLDCQHVKGVQCCTFMVREWLREEQELLTGLEAVLREMEKMLYVLADEKELEDVLETIVLLAEIKDGSLEKRPVFQQMVANCLERLSCDTFIFRILRHTTDPSRQFDHIEGIVKNIGPVAFFSLIARLADDISQQERDTLLALLNSFGDAVIPNLLDCLQQRPSRGMIQTVIRILSESKDETLWPVIEEYLGYPDTEVQREALNAVEKFNPARRRDRFLSALPLIDADLQVSLLSQFLEQNLFDEALYNVLSLLASRRAIFPLSTGFALLSRILAGLKQYPEQETLDILEQMQQDYRGSMGGEEVSLLIDDAISTIAPMIRHNSRQQEEISEMRMLPSTSALEETRLDAVEEQIGAYMEADDEAGARDFIFEQALEGINQKQYNLAEYLKNRLLEIDPFALAEVVKLGDRIEEHRLHAISPQQAELWKELAVCLSDEGFTLLYQNSIQERYHKGELLVAGGDTDRSLFFINAGSVSLSCRSGGLERFLRRVGPGTILGGEQFFDASVWTVTLRALTTVQVMVIGQKAWSIMEKDAPGIGEKLRTFCAKGINIAEMITLGGDDRRGQSRYLLNTKTRHQIANSSGGSMGEWFSGELLDISQGGVAFSCHFSSREKSRQFLGVQLRTSLEHNGQFSPVFHGLVVGVRLLEARHCLYSVHVKFARKIDGNEFSKILQKLPPRASDFHSFRDL